MWSRLREPEDDFEWEVSIAYNELSREPKYMVPDATIGEDLISLPIDSDHFVDLYLYRTHKNE